MADVWPMIRTEREASADLFDSLSSEQWTATTLCPQWNTKELAGHMIAAAEMTIPAFYAGFAKAGFRFNRMVDTDARRCSTGDPALLGARLRSAAPGPNHPPGPVVAMLGESIVHAEDIRRTLGLRRDYPEASLVAAADFYRRSNLLIGAKKRVAGLRLRATDADWAVGEGPEVDGPLLSLVMAMTGRQEAVGDLTGEGQTLLAARA